MPHIISNFRIEYKLYHVVKHGLATRCSNFYTVDST